MFAYTRKQKCDKNTYKQAQIPTQEPTHSLAHAIGVLMTCTHTHPYIQTKHVHIWILSAPLRKSKQTSKTMYNIIYINVCI